MCAPATASSSCNDIGARIQRFRGSAALVPSAVSSLYSKQIVTITGKPVF
jgi:hypothetical protein